MRRITLLFICIEACDVMTTIVGLHLGLYEANPLLRMGWAGLGLLKLCGVAIVALALQFKKPRRFDIAVPVTAILPVMWNAGMFLML